MGLGSNPISETYSAIIYNIDQPQIVTEDDRRHHVV